MSPELSVLHVLDNLDDSRGGTLAAVLGVANVTQSESVGVAIAATTSDDDEHVTLKSLRSDIRVHLFKRSLGGFLSWSWGLSRFLLREVKEHDVVMIHGVFSLPALVTGLACRLSGVPLIVRPHGSLDPFDLKKHARLKRLVVGPIYVRWLLKGCAFVCATAQREADDLVTYRAHPSVRVLGLPIPTAASLTLEEAGKFEGITDLRPYVLFMGRVDYKKGLPLLFEALAPKLAGGEARLVILGRGDDDYEQEMRDLTHKLGIAKSIHWAGWVTGPAKTAYVMNAQLFALLSDNENFGLAVVECLQLGCPVLISDQVYLAAELSLAGAAKVVPRDLQSARCALEEMLMNPEMRRGLATAGYRHALTKMNDDVVRRMHLLALNDVRRDASQRGSRTRISPVARR